MGEAYPLPGDTERDLDATAGGDATASAMRSLRAEVAALRESMARQNTRLERFDAFTETMFSRVERAVRAGVGETATPAPAPAAPPAPAELSEHDRATLTAIPARIDRLGAHLDQLGDYLTHLDARLTEVQDAAGGEALPLAEIDRAVLTTITARLDDLAESGRQRDERVGSIAGALETVQGRLGAPSELAEVDRDALAAIAGRLLRLEQRAGEASTTDLSDADRDVLATLAARLDQLDRRLVAPPATNLADADRGLLETVAERLEDVAEAVRGIDQRLAVLADLANRDPAPVALGDQDRERIDGVAQAVVRVEDRLATPAPRDDEPDPDRESMFDLLADRIDRMEQRILDAAGTGDDAQGGAAAALSDGDRDLLDRVVSTLADLEGPLRAMGSPGPQTAARSAGGDRNEPDDRARSQAIADIADAIDRAVGGMSKAKLKKLQKSLDQAAATAPAARPMRPAKPAPGSPQRQVVHLEREDPTGD